MGFGNYKGAEFISVPAGSYWIGDPCYSVPDNKWMEWLEDADYTSRKKVLFARIWGRHATVGVSTAFGDGCYLDQNGRPYGVDAGLIGLVPVALNHTLKEERSIRYRINLPTETLVGYRDGVIVIGDLLIDTALEEDMVMCAMCGEEYDSYENYTCPECEGYKPEED